MHCQIKFTILILNILNWWLPLMMFYCCSPSSIGWQLEMLGDSVTLHTYKTFTSYSRRCFPFLSCSYLRLHYDRCCKFWWSRSHCDGSQLLNQSWEMKISSEICGLNCTVAVIRIMVPLKNLQNLCHGCGFGMGTSNMTHTHTHLTHNHISAWVCKPVTCTK